MTLQALTKEQAWNHNFIIDGQPTMSQVPDSLGANEVKWKRVKKVLQGLTYSNALDVGCSDGYFSLKLAQANPGAIVTGIDLDQARIRKAQFVKSYFKCHNCSFKVAGYDDVSDRHDLVVALGFIHRVPNIDDALKKLANLGQNLVLEFKTLKGDKPRTHWAGGSSKSNKYNGLYHIPTVAYVEKALRSYGFRQFTVDLDPTHKLNYGRTVLLARR